MEQQYDNTNRGVLFCNDRKTKDNQPDYTGKLDIDGTERWLSAWLKKSKNGKQFLSISLGDVIEDKPATAPTAFPHPTTKKEKVSEVGDKSNVLNKKVVPPLDLEDDIPF